MTRPLVWLTGREPVRRWVLVLSIIDAILYTATTALHVLTQALA